MKKIVLLSLFLLCGLFLSQCLPSLWGEAYQAFSGIARWLMFICLAYIMINVGREFELDKTRWRSYTSDYFIAMATAAVPWLLIAFYYIFCLDSGLSWQNNLLISRFAAPTSAGILFTMLAAAGLKKEWIYQKTQVLAIFDDLDTILLMIPLQILMIGFKWQLFVVIVVVVALLMHFVYKERLGWIVNLGIWLAIAGVALLSWTPGDVNWWGLFFVLVSTLTYGSYIVVLNRPVLKRMNPDVLTCYALLFTALFYLLLGGVQGKMEFITRPRFLLDMFQLAVLSTILSARLLVSAVKLIGSVPCSVLGTLEPLTAIVIGVFYFQEHLSMLNYVGLVIVLIAVLIVILKKK